MSSKGEDRTYIKHALHHDVRDTVTEETIVSGATKRQLLAYTCQCQQTNGCNVQAINLQIHTSVKSARSGCICRQELGICIVLVAQVLTGVSTRRMGSSTGSDTLTSMRQGASWRRRSAAGNKLIMNRNAQSTVKNVLTTPTAVAPATSAVVGCASETCSRHEPHLGDVKGATQALRACPFAYSSGERVKHTCNKSSAARKARLRSRVDAVACQTGNACCFKAGGQHLVRHPMAVAVPLLHVR